MRVVLVVGRSTGGIGTHVGQLATDLRALGHDVDVVTDVATARRFGWDRAGDGLSALTWWPRDLVSLARWRGRLRELARGADVVHAHGLQAGAAVALALPGGPAGSAESGTAADPDTSAGSGTSARSRSATSRPSTRVVVSLHNPPPRAGLAGRVGQALARVAVRRADLVTGASSDLVALARQLGARQAHLAPVPSPLVPALLTAPVPSVGDRAARVAALSLGARPLVLTVSRIARQKRLDIVAAAAALLRHRADVLWAVAGDGDPALRASLESQTAGTNVVLLGARTDIPELLRAATVLVVSSDWEARALVVQEAMAAGIPVIATDVGGLRELLAGTGVLVPPGSPALLASALDSLLDEVLADPSRVADLAGPGRELAASWADGPATAREWARWYAATDP